MENIVTMGEEHYRYVRSENKTYYIVPSEEVTKMTFDHVEKRPDHQHHHHQAAFSDHHNSQKPYYYVTTYEGPYLQAAAHQGHHQQPYIHKSPYVKTAVAPQGHTQQSISHNGPYQQTTMAHQGEIYQGQVPAVKKLGGVIDCNEAAKRYGGVVFTEYGRNNKFRLRA